MVSSQQPPRLWARIDDAGLLSVTGLPEHPGGLTADHLDPEDAYAELINLALDLAVTVGGPVWLRADTPTGVWAMGVHPDGTTIPVPTELLDPEPNHGTAGATGEPVDLEAALAALGEWNPPPAGVVLALAADPAAGVRAAAVAELSTWGDDPDVVVDADLTAEQLAALGDCRLSWVRAGVAGHPRTDRITLDHLAGDADPLVVQALAARLDLPAELVTALAGHPQPVVRAELGRNPAAAFLAHPHKQAATEGGVAVITAPAPRPGAGDPPRDARPAPPPVPATRPAGRGVGRRQLASGLAAGALLLGGSAAAWLAVDASDAPRAAAAMVAWQGTWLPSGPDGPIDPSAPTAAGFRHTELGAAMAAAHLSVRIDSYAGPGTFRPTITGQTYGGDPAALLARTTAAYRQAAADAGVTDGGPIPTSPGRIVGWRTDTWAPDGPVTVHLLVTTAAGDALDFAIDVTWVDGDYRLVDPTRDDTFVTTADPDPANYTRF